MNGICPFVRRVGVEGLEDLRGGAHLYEIAGAQGACLRSAHLTLLSVRERQSASANDATIATTVRLESRLPPRPAAAEALKPGDAQ